MSEPSEANLPGPSWLLCDASGSGGAAASAVVAAQWRTPSTGEKGEDKAKRTRDGG